MSKITGNRITYFKEWQMLVDKAVQQELPVIPLSFEKTNDIVSHEIDVLRSFSSTLRAEQEKILDHSFIRSIDPDCSEGIALLFELTVLTQLRIKQVEQVVDFAKTHNVAEFQEFTHELSEQRQILQRLDFIAHEIFSWVSDGNIGYIALQTFYPKVNLYSELIQSFVAGQVKEDTLLAYDRMSTTRNAKGETLSPKQAYQICKAHNFDPVSIELAILAWENSGKSFVPYDAQHRFNYESTAFLSFEQAEKFILDLYQLRKPKETKLSSRYTFGEDFEKELKKHFDFVCGIAQSPSLFFTEQGFDLKEWEQEYSTYIERLLRMTLSVRPEYRDSVMQYEMSVRKLWGLTKDSQRMSLSQARVLFSELHRANGNLAFEAVNREALLLHLDDTLRCGREISARVLFSLVYDLLQKPVKNTSNIFEQIQYQVKQFIDKYQQNRITEEELNDLVRKAEVLIENQPHILENYLSLFQSR